MAKILTSLHGQKAGFDSAGRLIVPAGLIVGNDGNQFNADANVSTYTLFDDFVGDTLNSNLWHNPTKGSDPATVDFAIAQDINGRIRGTTGAGAGGTMAVNGILIDGGLSFKANTGGLSFQTRLKASAITNIVIFAGLTDQVSTLEMPFTLSGSTLTSNTTDGVGFLFDTGATAATWKLVGCAADTDATLQEAVQSTSITTTAPAANTYQTLRVELGTDGSANFWIDGKKVGVKMSGAVTATVALTPVIAVFTKTAASATLDVDYIYVSANRS